MRTRALPLLSLSLLALGFAGCSDKKGEPAQEEKNPFTTPSVDWPTQPLSESISESVDGIPFTVSLPASLKKEVKKTDGTLPGYVHWLGPSPFMDPSFTVQPSTFPPKNLEAAIESAGIPAEPTKVVASGPLEGGGFYVSIVADSNQFLEVEGWQPTADKGVVSFSTSVRHSDGIANTDALRLWMESVVKTFRTK